MRHPRRRTQGDSRVSAPVAAAGGYRRGCAVTSALLAALLLLFPPLAAPAGATAFGSLQSRIAQAQQRLQELTGRRQAQQSVVERLRGRTQGFAFELGQVEEALFAIIGRLRQAEEELLRVESELEALEIEIAEKQVAVEARSAVYTTRLRAMYKFTRSSPLEQLLAARDFGDALGRVTMMQAVTRVDNLLLGQLRAEQAELLRAQETLQRKQAEAVVLRDEIDLQRTALDVRRAQQAILLEEARRDQGSAEGQLTEYDQQARAEQSSIATLQEQYQRELEEQEHRRQEELRRQDELRRQQASATAQAQSRAQATAQAAEAARSAQAAQAAQGATATAQARAQATSRAQQTAQARVASTSTPAPQRSPTPLAPPAGQPATVGQGARPPAPTATPSRPMPTATAAPRSGLSGTPGASGTFGPRSGTAGASQGGGTVLTTGLSPTADGFQWPVTNPFVTTEFGERSPFQASHTGIDLATALYAPVRAAADGIVIDSGLAVAGKPSQSYGMRVSIAHKGGVATLYAHLEDEKYKPAVKAGERVERGQVIGYIGMTGLTTGPHLHFEVLAGGEPRNPRAYLPR